MERVSETFSEPTWAYDNLNRLVGEETGDSHLFSHNGNG
jgi:hypothetical protein